jgi:inorganic phosphate transporter, PiT family
MAFTLLILIIGLALLFDFINGFHDAANSISTVVATKVLRPFTAVLWAGMFNFLALWVFGFGIADTIAKTADTTKLNLVVLLAGILAAIFWDLLTWYRGIPSSSSHTLIGGFAGAAIAHGGTGIIQWFKAGSGGFPPTGVLVTLSFIVLAPMLGMLVSYLLSIWALRSANGGIITKIFTVCVAVFTSWFVWDKLKFYKAIKAPRFPGNEFLSVLTEVENIKWYIVFVLIFSLCCLFLFLGSMNSDRADWWFRKFQILSSAAFSIGHGGNDAQKVMGLIAATVLVYINTTKQNLNSLPEWLRVSFPKPNEVTQLPQWIPFTCHLVIGLGTMAGGWKIIKTMGTKITKVTPFEGVMAETAGALTLYTTEYFKVPVSTTHTITGSIIGTGLTKRLSAIRWPLTGKIFWAWVLTIPCSAAIAATLYYILSVFIKL